MLPHEIDSFMKRKTELQPSLNVIESVMNTHRQPEYSFCLFYLFIT